MTTQNILILLLPLCITIHCLPIIQEPKNSPPLLQIVGGEYSRADESTTCQVSIQSLTGQHFCGGAIVGEEWVLTVSIVLLDLAETL